MPAVKDLLAGRSGPDGCEVEIGCGNGHFLVSYAAARPGSLLIGIDIKARRCRRAREKVEKRGLPNVQIIHAAAEMFLTIASQYISIRSRSCESRSIACRV